MPFSGNGKKELPGEEKVSPFAEHSTRSGKTGAETQDGKTGGRKDGAGLLLPFFFSSSSISFFHSSPFLARSFSFFRLSFFHCENWKGEK